MLIKPITPLPLIISPGDCRAWLDPADTSAANLVSSGNVLSRINDKTGNGSYAFQSTVARQPQTGIQTQNGLNVISFAAANTQFLNFIANTPLSVPFTLFLVVQSNSTAALQNFIGRQTAATAGQWTLRRESSSGVFNTFAFGSGGSSQVSKAPNNNANIHCVTFDNGVGITYRLNNGSVDTGAVRSGYDNSITTGLALGASNDTGSGSLDGWIGDVIIYGSVWSANKIAGMSRWLGNKWGITVS